VQESLGRSIDEEVLLRAIESAPDGIIVVGADGNIVFANSMAERLFGYETGDLAGRNVDELIPDSLRAGHAAHRKNYMQHPRTRPMGTGLDLHGRRRSGEEFPVEISLSAVTTERSTEVIAIVRDVTARRAADEALQRAFSELTLSEDRERIARDLHDTVIQRLFAIGLSLQGGLTRTEDEATRTRIEGAIDEIDTAIRDLRSAIFSLHTRRAVGTGVRDEVVALATETARALGFQPAVRFEGLVDAEVTDDVREQLIPSVREALTNVVKHAQATRVSVSLSVTDEIVLIVTDNGVGMREADSGGRGLGNMAERAEALGGTCTLRAGESGGTVLEWRVPLAG
jgi:PAS domain S-box-containing protein